MKSFLCELWPLLRLLLLGMMGSLLLGGLVGGPSQQAPTYWDGGDESSQAADVWEKVQADSLHTK